MRAAVCLKLLSNTERYHHLRKFSHVPFQSVPSTTLPGEILIFSHYKLVLAVLDFIINGNVTIHLCQGPFSQHALRFTHVT